MKLLPWLCAIPLAIVVPDICCMLAMMGAKDVQHTDGAEANTVPNFTRGTMSSHTESSTTITETFRIVENSTATSYTMSGTNIQWTGTPTQNTTYTQVLPGAATQFTETYLGPGISTITDLTRTTTTLSTTDSISVFTQ